MRYASESREAWAESQDGRVKADEVTKIRNRMPNAEKVPLECLDARRLRRLNRQGYMKVRSSGQVRTAAVERMANLRGAGRSEG